MKSKQTISWVLMGLVVLFVSCSKSSDEAKGLTFGDEMELMWEKALPYLAVNYEPEYTDANEYEEALSTYLYFDEYTQLYDYTRDVNGDLFSPILMKDTAKDGMFYYEWKNPERYGDYAPILEHFISRNDVPVIADLEYYFSDVPTNLLIPTEGGCLDGVSESVDRPYFFEKLHKLQLFQDGKTDVFPVEIVHYLRHYEQHIACSMGHAGEVPEYLYCFLFQYRLLQQVTRLCPDITMMATAISDDHMIAVDDVIYTSGDYYYHTDRAFVFLRQPDGQYAVDLVYIYPGKAKISKHFENAHYIVYKVTTDYSHSDDATFCYDKRKQRWLREN